MTKKESLALIHTLKQNYVPYHPINNPDLPIYVHYIKDAMDEEESHREGERLFYFEFYTEPQLYYLEESLLNENINYEHGAFSFTALLPVNDKRINLIEKIFSQKYVKCSLKKDISSLHESEIFLPGLVEFSYYIKQEYYSENELPHFSNAYLCIDSLEPLKNDVLLSRIDEIFTNINSGISVSEFPKTDFPNSDGDIPIDKITVKIYRLGGANAAYATYPNNKSLLIDCGCDRYDPNKYIAAMTDINKKVRPSGIIISHWHIDHYALFSHIDCSNLEVLVVTSKKDMPNNISAKVKSLQKMKHITILETSNGSFSKNILSKYDFLRTNIYIGNGQTPSPQSGFGSLNYKSICNESAIMVYIGTPRKSLILPSDVSYYNWPTANNPELVIKDYQRFVVPHHGLSIYTNNNPDKINGANLYISSAFDNISYYTPGPSHRTFLNRILNGPNVSSTYYYSKYFPRQKYRFMYL